MSTLGRKAMRKTLKRLKEDAFRDAKQCNDYIKSLAESLLKEKGKMDEDTRGLIAIVTSLSSNAMFSLLRYIQALEDYGYELDEEWDNLLKSVEEVKQAKPMQKKEDAKKTSYIK